jgi:hypothetical protein
MIWRMGGAEQGFWVAAQRGDYERWPDNDVTHSAEMHFEH